MPLIPVAAITAETLRAMVGNDAEGQRLEFKVDLPVHKQRQDEARRAGQSQAHDTWWTGNSVSGHARDALLEEVVAFANAQGGQLILGMDEEDGTRVAKALCPLPRITGLEQRFRDFLLDGIEPRLPQAIARAVPTEPDGSGLLVIEVEASRLGPHRVKATRNATIRRDDSCVPLSMAEVHEMVLRNARRFDEVRAALDHSTDALDAEFLTFLVSKKPNDAFRSVQSPSTMVDGWLSRDRLAAYAIRIALVAHEDLGIPRLRSFADLAPGAPVTVEVPQSPVVGLDFRLWPSLDTGDRFLGGVRQGLPLNFGLLTFSAKREGVVETTLLSVGPPDHLTLVPDELAGLFGCTLGIYDKLRGLAGRPGVPAEITAVILARGNIRVRFHDRQLAGLLGRTLPSRTEFPRRTVADAADCTAVLNDAAQDLLDAANASANPFTRRFAYTPPAAAAG